MKTKTKLNDERECDEVRLKNQNRLNAICLEK